MALRLVFRVGLSGYVVEAGDVHLLWREWFKWLVNSIGLKNCVGLLYCIGFAEVGESRWRFKVNFRHERRTRNFSRSYWVSFVICWVSMNTSANSANILWDLMGFSQLKDSLANSLRLFPYPIILFLTQYIILIPQKPFTFQDLCFLEVSDFDIFGLHLKFSSFEPVKIPLQNFFIWMNCSHQFFIIIIKDVFLCRWA